ncbi:reverse transcriptase domain-containing protein [Tanacetum coccineum]
MLRAGIITKGTSITYVGNTWNSLGIGTRSQHYDFITSSISLPIAWAEEVPNVLWAHRTMKKTSNGETPFGLTYGTEVVIPAEIGMPTHRTSSVNEKTNDQELRLNLNLLEERREIAAIREARYKQQVEKYYNKKVRHVQFKVGEFVLQRNEVSRAANTGKQDPPGR